MLLGKARAWDNVDVNPNSCLESQQAQASVTALTSVKFVIPCMPLRVIRHQTYPTFLHYLLFKRLNFKTFSMA